MASVTTRSVVTSVTGVTSVTVMTSVTVVRCRGTLLQPVVVLVCVPAGAACVHLANGAGHVVVVVDVHFVPFVRIGSSAVRARRVSGHLSLLVTPWVSGATPSEGP